MFVWTRESVGWFEAAESRSEYYKAIAGSIAKYLPVGANICDIGCGTGALAAELSKYCASVTAIDIDRLAISVLRGRCCENVSPVCADIFSYIPVKVFDAAVFCCFGNKDELITFMQGRLAKNYIFIESANIHHNFSLGSGSLRKQKLEGLVLWLEENGVEYMYENKELEFGQLFKSVEDAVAFFKHYDKADDFSYITADKVEQRLIKTENREYPFYLPAYKRIRMIVVEENALKLNMPERLTRDLCLPQETRRANEAHFY